MATSKTKEPKVKTELIVMGRKSTATGKSVIDAVGKLKPEISKGRGILTVTQGKESKERILMPNIVYRLFNSHGMTRDIALKNISLLFENKRCQRRFKTKH